ncbi:hypothetical protein EV421DRAFT_1739097 [Armillaria borealis]|uniref:Uncharacterized protein n=1 Tax=Armillaria borealis TaxID=47425 RepID=A0AA39J802_9AGAR|nr:hypothetical protein EV421DRAFT_1739097 [Armillaria borealis]
MSSVLSKQTSLHSDYLGQWRSDPQFVLSGNYLDFGFQTIGGSRRDGMQSRFSAGAREIEGIFLPSSLVFLKSSFNLHRCKKVRLQILQLWPFVSLSHLLSSDLLTLNSLQCGDPPNPPLEHKCSFIKDGKPCKWSFNRRYDCDRHKRSHLKGAARVEHLHYCPLGTSCPMKFKNLQLANLRMHIKTVHRDIQHLICQMCRPFVLTADPVAFAQHQAEKHGRLHLALLPRIVPNPTPPATLGSSPPTLSRSTTPDRITLVPLATLLRYPPTPTHPMPPSCSFIVHVQLLLPAEGPCLQPIILPHCPREA